MAATLLTADRSSARAAAAGPAEPDAFEPTAVTEAVFRAIADGQVHSLDDIGRALAQSASRIAGEVQRLQRYGMAIDESADTVRAAPVVPLDRAALTSALTALRGAGGAAWDVEVVFATPSTSSDLLAAVRARLPIAPVVRAAEVQLAGRGRLGRRWSSAPGASLTASFALAVGRRLSQLDGATLVCGLAVHAVLTDLGVRTHLKWPNDVLVDGGKLAGILVDAHAAGESSVLVIGIGLNVAGGDEPGERPSESGGLARTTLASAGSGNVDRNLLRTTLASAGSGNVDRNLLAARLARSLEAHMDAFEAGGFGPFVERWNAVNAFADRGVTLEAERGTRKTGIARGVDDRGALLVDIDGRRERILAGDVSLRPASGTTA